MYKKWLFPKFPPTIDTLCLRGSFWAERGASNHHVYEIRGRLTKSCWADRAATKCLASEAEHHEVYQTGHARGGRGAGSGADGGRRGRSSCPCAPQTGAGASCWGLRHCGSSRCPSPSLHEVALRQNFATAVGAPAYRFPTTNGALAPTKPLSEATVRLWFEPASYIKTAT